MVEDTPPIASLQWNTALKRRQNERARDKEMRIKMLVRSHREGSYFWRGHYIKAALGRLELDETHG